MSKVYVFLAEGFEEIEGLTVVDLLRRAKIDTEMVSVMDGKQIKGSHGIKVTADSMFADVDFSDADVLVLPGGMPGTLNLGNHEGLCELLKKHYEEKKMIAAICAAPALVFGKLVFGKQLKMTCYPGFEGVLPVHFELSSQGVVRDGNVITAKGPGFAVQFGLAILEQLRSVDIAKEVAAGMLI